MFARGGPNAVTKAFDGQRGRDTPLPRRALSDTLGSVQTNEEWAVAMVEAKTEVTGTVWRIVAEVGQRVEAGETIMIIESMKMEIPVSAEEAGVIHKVLVEEKALVSEGQVVATLT
jgi:acetyl-CoA carboxylase biotin carboxyl carrier protein